MPWLRSEYSEVLCGLRQVLLPGPLLIYMRGEVASDLWFYRSSEFIFKFLPSFIQQMFLEQEACCAMH